MNGPGSASAVERRVQCPICVDFFLWSPDMPCWLFSEHSQEYQQVDLAGMINPAKQADMLRQGYVRCPNPSGDSPTHYLPATYADYSDPVIVGLIGASGVGKTHLLVSIVGEIDRGGLAGLGIHSSALDLRRQVHFRRAFLEPVERGFALPPTLLGTTDYSCALLMRTPTRQTPVVLFDMAGEDLAHSPDSSRFLLAANALLFASEADDAEMAMGRRKEDLATSTVIERLRQVGRTDGVSAAMVMTKADRQRFDYPVRNWLVRDQDPRLDPDRIRAESRDVYAYLHSRGQSGALTPFEVFPRCTLHFASATGADVGPDGTFARGVRPLRVLQPLVSILAMTGVIDGAEAERVGY